MITTDLFRAAMALMPAAVHIITTGEGDERIGVTASSVASFSASPPSIIVSFDENSGSAAGLRRAERFCVNMLKDCQADLSDVFAGKGGLRGAERFTHGDWDLLATGCPALKDAASSLDCEVLDRSFLAGRLVLVGTIIACRMDGACSPMVYQNRGYRKIAA